MERTTATVGNHVTRQPSRGDALFHGSALIGAAGLAALTASGSRWSPAPLLVLTGVHADQRTYPGTHRLDEAAGVRRAAWLDARHGASRGAPAAAIGTVTMAVGWLRRREAAHYLLSNLVTYAWFPLIGGLFFHAAVRLTDVGPLAIAYYLVVFATFVVALGVNFTLVVGVPSASWTARRSSRRPATCSCRCCPRSSSQRS